MVDKTKKKRSIREKIEHVLEVLLGKFRGYPDDDDDEDLEPEELDPNYRLKWKIGISDEDAKPK